VRYDSNIGVLLEYLVEWAIITLHRMFKSLLSIKNVIETLLFLQLCQLQNSRTMSFINWRRKH